MLVDDALFGCRACVAGYTGLGRNNLVVLCTVTMLCLEGGQRERMALRTSASGGGDSRSDEASQRTQAAVTFGLGAVFCWFFWSRIDGASKVLIVLFGGLAAMCVLLAVKRSGA